MECCCNSPSKSDLPQQEFVTNLELVLKHGEELISLFDINAIVEEKENA